MGRDGMVVIAVSLSQKTRRGILCLWIQFSRIGRVICALVEIVKISRISNVGERNEYVPVFEGIHTFDFHVCRCCTRCGVRRHSPDFE
jgi:hypothetical protein